MEKDAAATDTVDLIDNFICRSSITRSDMLFITFGSSIFAKKTPKLCLDRRPSPFLHSEGVLLFFVLPYGFWWSLSRIFVTQLKHEMAACPIRLLLRDVAKQKVIDIP